MSFNLRDSEQIQVSNSEQLEALFNFATIGMIVTNTGGQIIDFNRFAEKLFGYSKPEVLGKKVEVLIPAAVYDDHIRYREEYFSSPQVRAIGHGRDLYAQKKSGTVFPVEVSLSHYCINHQTFVIAFVIDIAVRKKQEEVMLRQKQELERITTEIKAANSELEQKVNDRTKMLREALVELEKSKEELNEAFENEKELSELKSRFVTIASHEFRTPLSTILSSAFLLEKYNQDNTDPRVKKHLQRIKSAVAGMKGILEDCLSLNKLEDRRVQTRTDTVSAIEIIEDLNGLRLRLERLLKPGQQLQFDYAICQTVQVDRNLLKSILTNLISNAIKFSNANATITLSATVAGNHLTISIGDNGIGIPEQDKAYLFKRFFRAKNAVNIEGTGLGLHIVNKYLELMNGRIEMTSTLNQGSTFTIYIPQHINPALYEKDISYRR